VSVWTNAAADEIPAAQIDNVTIVVLVSMTNPETGRRRAANESWRSREGRRSRVENLVSPGVDGVQLGWTESTEDRGGSVKTGPD
jgi:hypothetical protein